MKIVFFAQVREQLGEAEITLVQDCATVEDLVNLLAQRGENWSQVLTDPNTLVAVNQQMASMQTSLTAATEVAFFPLMTGG